MKLTKTRQPDVWNGFGLNRWNDWDRELENFFHNPFTMMRAPESLTGWMPALDVYEEKDDLLVTVEVPGMKKEDIKISLNDGVMTISGERTEETKKEEQGVYHTERSFGRFSRSVSLPIPVQDDKIKADYKDGILTVRLPKAEEAKPKQINIA